jgi:hypothetical protein
LLYLVTICNVCASSASQALRAHHDMDVDEFLGVGSVFVTDRVDPFEELPALAPILLPVVFFLFVQAVVFLPNGG